MRGMLRYFVIFVPIFVSVGGFFGYTSARRGQWFGFSGDVDRGGAFHADGALDGGEGAFGRRFGGG